jgi:hypothetical protein
MKDKQDLYLRFEIFRLKKIYPLKRQSNLNYSTNFMHVWYCFHVGQKHFYF